MRIIVEGNEEIIKTLDKISELTDELRSTIFRLGSVYARFKEETASAETEAEERN